MPAWGKRRGNLGSALSEAKPPVLPMRSFSMWRCTGWVGTRRAAYFGPGGKPGDALYVTGRLGGSIKGKHLDFVPRVAEARWLTAHFKLRAMMDLSDGLEADLPRLAAASGCDYEIFDDRIPACRPDAPPAQARNDGEDYELLFAVTLATPNHVIGIRVAKAISPLAT